MSPLARWRTSAAAALGASPVPSRRARLLGLAAVFLLALAVRSLYAVDLAPVMYSRVQPGTRMAWRYDEAAVGILRGEGILWPRHPDPARTGLLARPPGYPLYMAIVYRGLGRTFFAVQLLQNVLTAAGCVLLSAAVARLIGGRVGIAGGLVAAVSPHLAFSSNFILPDGLSAIPLLAALVLLAHAHPGPRARWWVSAAAGALVGAGVWLRPNVMLLPPLLAVVVVLVARDRRRALGHAAALLAAAVLLVAPITLRNYAVFGEWVPVSINGGLTLWQGVADAGGEAAGAFRRDKLVMDEEAERYGNPRYREWWAEPDGIFRDRERYRRAREVIRAHPLLYARVVAGRALEMLSYHTEAGPPTLGRETAAAELLARTEDDDVDDARAHDLARQPSDGRFLAPGRAAAPVRRALGLAQALLLPMLSPLAILGAAIVLMACWRPALVLLSLPLYYLSTESFFLYEWRVAVPMHYAMMACAAVPLVLALAAVRRRPLAPGSEPGRIAGRAIRPRAAPDEPFRIDDVVLVVEGVRVLDRELFAVIGRAVPEAADLGRHRGPVAVGVADEGTSLLAPVLAHVEQRGIVANGVVDGPLDVVLEPRSLHRAAVAAAVAGTEAAGPAGRRVRIRGRRRCRVGRVGTRRRVHRGRRSRSDHGDGNDHDRNRHRSVHDLGRTARPGQVFRDRLTSSGEKDDRERGDALTHHGQPHSKLDEECRRNSLSQQEKSRVRLVTP